MRDHLDQTCPLRSVMCRNGCGQRIIAKEAGNHYREGCPKRYSSVGEASGVRTLMASAVDCDTTSLDAALLRSCGQNNYIGNVADTRIAAASLSWGTMVPIRLPELVRRGKSTASSNRHKPRERIIYSRFVV